MNAASFPHREFILTGTAIPVDAEDMLAEICEHFVDHSDVFRDGDHVTLSSEIGEAYISKVSEQLDIKLDC